MQKTNISWTEYTWNPLTGCELPLISDGCRECYARSLHNMRHKAYKAGKKLPQQYAKPFEEIQLFPERLEEPLHKRKPCTIFLGSMTDIFGRSVPFEFVDKVYAVMALCPQHTFITCTKRADRQLEYYSCKIEGFDTRTRLAIILAKKATLSLKPEISKYYYAYYNMELLPFPNIWQFVTICNQEEADLKIPLHLQTPAAHRGLSIEPMLGEIDLDFGGNMDEDEDSGVGCCSCVNGGIRHQHYISEPCLCRRHINQVILGGETGPKARPMELDWARKVRDDCKEAGIPFYLKSLGQGKGRELDGREHNDLAWRL